MFLPIRDYRRSRTTPVLTFVIIGINVLVFLFQTFMVGGSGGEAEYGIVRGSQCVPLSGSDRFIFEIGVKPCELFGTCGETRVCVIENRRVVDVTTVEGPFPASPLPAWLTIFSAMFVHGGLLHIASNMWFLWIFGDNVEDRMGTGRFLIFYLLTGLVAAAAQIVSNPASSTPMVGASGAVAGVLGAYMMLYPHGRVLTLMWIVWFIQFIELPAVIVLGMWILLQVIQALIGQGMLSGGGVAYLAHIGGFLAGVVLVKVFARPEQPDYL
ncbi:MAG: rhomboid family intramembrane serine protease [Candidatus Bipolaricaulia bacterium]